MIETIFFLPHGMEIIPDVKGNRKKEFGILNNKMIQMTQSVIETEVSSTVFITPHGYNLKDDFVVYKHANYLGYIYSLHDDSVVYGDIKESIEISGDTNLSNQIEESMKSHKLPVEGLVNGFEEYPLILNWGSVVPIYYLNQHKEFDYSFICIPRRRHDNLGGLLGDLEILADILLSVDKTIKLVISGDLSHVHDENGPYGYHDSAVEFDNLVMNWMETQSDSDMKKLLDLQPKALACGMAGMFLIHEMMSKAEFKLRDSFYEVPTYFGMGAAKWDNIS